MYPMCKKQTRVIECMVQMQSQFRIVHLITLFLLHMGPLSFSRNQIFEACCLFKLLFLRLPRKRQEISWRFRQPGENVCACPETDSRGRHNLPIEFWSHCSILIFLIIYIYMYIYMQKVEWLIKQTTTTTTVPGAGRGGIDINRFQQSASTHSGAEEKKRRGVIRAYIYIYIY